MLPEQRKAFSMLELTFVIVIIGILSAVAVPKLAATRDDAVITSAISTVASVRNAIAVERQKRILRGDYTLITDLAFADGVDKDIFDFYDVNNTVGNEVLEYPLRSCIDASARGCWITGATSSLYIYRMPASSNDITFTLGNSRFTCDTANVATGTDCKLLTQ